jgi:hypothetical protein
MSTASYRRQRSRIKFLAQLNATDQERFQIELSKREQSWLHLIIQEINSCLEKDRPPSAAFRICDCAAQSLKAFGPDGVARARLLTEECCRRLALAFDPRLYRLSNMAQICENLDARKKPQKRG